MAAAASCAFCRKSCWASAVACEALGVEVEICHLNEGHAAFVVLERARCFMEEHQVDFWEALWATRVGNIFTTHTPVAAGFDTFSPRLIEKYFPYFHRFTKALNISVAEVLGPGPSAGKPGRTIQHGVPGHAWLCPLPMASVDLHGEVSRRIFAPLFPHWPEAETP